MMPTVDLYSSYLTTAPVILLAISRSFVFGPTPSSARHRNWRWPLWHFGVDMVTVVAVLTGAAVSLLVLGDVLPRQDTARDIVVYSGVLSLFLLFLHVGGDVLGLYIADRDATHATGSTEQRGERVA